MPPKKKKAKKFTFKTFDARAIEATVKEGELFVQTDSYIMWSPKGKEARCDAIGVDIGSVHLAFVGLQKIVLAKKEEAAKHTDIDFLEEEQDCAVNRKKHFGYEISWVCLVCIRSSSVAKTLDVMDAMLVLDANFARLRACPYIRIELQVFKNKKAQKIASVLRSCFRTIQMLAAKTPNVAYVDGESKYKVASDVGIRPASVHEQARGVKNKPLRKKIAVSDLIALMQAENNVRVLEFLQALHPPSFVKPGEKRKRGNANARLDKLDDIADSYLVVRYALQN